MEPAKTRKKITMRRIFLCLLVIVLQSVPILAQQAPPSEPGTSSYDLWLVRSQTITADLIKDSADLPRSERALLWARLAQRWWLDDPEKARAWILKPIEIVEAVPNKENPDERLQRLSTVRSLLPIVAPLDQKLSARLVAVLTQDSEQQAKEERAANADGLIEAAVSLVDTDPQRAAELGALALRVGHPTLLPWLIRSLRTKNPNLADVLFTQTIAAARQSLDTELLNSLSNVAFPESREIGGAPNMAMTDALKTEVLKTYVAYVQANQINPETRNSVCGMLGWLIDPILPQFDRLLPQQAIFVRQSINQCHSTNPPAQQLFADALRVEPLTTIDDLLKAGDDAKDVKIRTIYQFRAAKLAMEQKDPDRALKILDTMSAESREFMGGAWESFRWDWAATAALQHLATGDVGGMRLIINAVPSDLQPFAKMVLVDRLPADRNKDTDPTLEFLSDVRTGFRRATDSGTDISGSYIFLLKLIVKYQPTEATGVLKEAITALNHADEAKAKAKKDSHDDHTWFSGSEVFSAALLEMDEYTVREAVASISTVDTRVQVRLEFLRVCLERMRSAKQITPKPKTSKVRGRT
jgi:hypothetical protein